MNKRITFATILIALWVIAHSASSSPANTISGIVLDDSGRPILGASVVLVQSSVILTGQATDCDGKFALTCAGIAGEAELHISAVGYAAKTIALKIEDKLELPDIMLASSPPDVGTITVTPEQRPSLSNVTSAVALRKQARQSLIPSDPISSLTGPSTARQGSSHSAQIRVDGTNPQYYLNDIPIGTDPCHYGAFAVIPMPVINEMRFYPYGTPANFGTPSAVEFATSENFTRHRDAEVQLSTIDLTTRVSAGSEAYSLLGSVRKSVLDELVTKIESKPDRRTIPPTSFLDMYVSSGWRASSVLSVTIDQYHVRDKLSFNTAGATGQAYGVDTRQKTYSSYAAMRVKALYPTVLVRGSIGIQASNKQYSAQPEVENADQFKLDLNERVQDQTFSLSAEWTGWGMDFDAGTDGIHRSTREIELEQESWNFLPPFANSNNGHMYQVALNRDWQQYHGKGGSYQQALYVTAERRLGKFTLQAGVRGEYFNSLRLKSAIVHRQSVAFEPTSTENITVYHGTFAESPVDNILEPYQVIISAQQARLRPIRTDLWSLGFTHRTVQVSVFHKKLTDRPVITPDFDQVDYEAQTVGRDFLVVRSNGTASFTGGTASVDLQKFPWSNFTTRLWYGYTKAEKTENNVVMPYELNAPHRFGGAVQWRVATRWSLGGEIQVRSGYPYSPTRDARLLSFNDYYSPAYYQSSLAAENSLRFPASAFLNVHAGFSFNSGTAFFSISNVTNRANPIVNSTSGFIYDAGILPMIGLELNF